MITHKKTVLASSVLLLMFANSAFAWRSICVAPNRSGCQPTIQAAVDAAAPGDTIKIGSGVYNESVTINTPNLSLVGASCATAIEACTSTSCGNAGISINAPGIRVKNLSIGHGNPGIAINNSNASIANDCFYDNSQDIVSSGDAVLIAYNQFKGGSGSTISLNGNGVRILYNKLLNTDNGISVSGDNVEITANTLTLCNDDGINIYGNNAVLQNNNVSACQGSVGVNGDNATVMQNTFAASYGNFYVYGHDANVQQNTMTGTQGGFYITGNRPNIQNNTVMQTSSGMGISCTPDVNNTGLWDSCDPGTGKIAGNSISYSYDDSENLAVQGSHLDISNNQLKFAAQRGIYFVGNNATIKNNIIANSGTEDMNYAGIYLEFQSNNNLVDSNQITDASYLGIKNNGGNNNTYSRNIITGSGRSALAIWGGNANTVDANKVSANRGEGINNLGNGTIITNNTANGNKTDICNQGGIATFTGNSYVTGGETGVCKVDGT